MSLTISSVNVGLLQPDPENPRKHDSKNLNSIRKSLKEHGQVEPLVVQKSTMMVVGGNARLQTMKNLGWKQADVVLLDISDVEARKLSISLNRSGELAGWDDEILAKHLADLSELSNFDPETLGFSDNELMQLLAEFDKIEYEDIDAEDMLEDDIIDDTEINESELKIPAGMSPETMRSSHIRMVQLFYNEDTEPLFRYRVKMLAQEFGTDNISDTVFKAIKQVSETLGIGDHE